RLSRSCQRVYSRKSRQRPKRSNPENRFWFLSFNVLAGGAGSLALAFARHRFPRRNRRDPAYRHRKPVANSSNVPHVLAGGAMRIKSLTLCTLPLPVPRPVAWHEMSIGVTQPLLLNPFELPFIAMSRSIYPWLLETGPVQQVMLNDGQELWLP